jgi:hypothetical protein
VRNLPRLLGRRETRRRRRSCGKLQRRTALWPSRCGCSQCERGGVEEVWGDAGARAPFIGGEGKGGATKAVEARSVASGH